MVPVADSLYEAISSYDLDAVNRFIESGVDVNAKLNKAKTPLKVAVDRHAVKIGRALIKNGADVHTRHNGATLLHDAAKAGDLGFTKLLLESGVSRNVKD